MLAGWLAGSLAVRGYFRWGLSLGDIVWGDFVLGGFYFRVDIVRGDCTGGLCSDTSTQARTVPGHTKLCQLNGRNMNRVGCGFVLTGAWLDINCSMANSFPDKLLNVGRNIAGKCKTLCAVAETRLCVM